MKWSNDLHFLKPLQLEIQFHFTISLQSMGFLYLQFCSDALYGQIFWRSDENILYFKYHSVKYNNACRKIIFQTYISLTLISD